MGAERRGDSWGICQICAAMLSRCEAVRSLGRFSALLKRKLPALHAESGEPCFTLLLRHDGAHGAAALTSAAVDPRAGVDDGLTLHGDRADGAGIHTSAAGNAAVSDLPCHVEYTSKKELCFGPLSIVTHLWEIAIRNFS